MSPSVISKIEESIFALPLIEQKKLIARVTKILRKQEDMRKDEQLRAMASDPLIQQELSLIESEFVCTELDGLSK